MIDSEIGGSIEEYDVYEQIGKGGFAIVYKARCRSTNKDVAIKKIDKNSLTKQKIIERVRQEVSIHSKLDHPSILKLFTFFEDDYFVYLVLELCPNGHLSQQIPFSEREAQEYLAQVVGGMLYLHSQGIMHRDLSLANLLFDSRGRIKIADFGLATQLKKPEDSHTTMCGTPNYISPEVATRSSHGLKADVWSLGCLLYTMLVGKPPFEKKCAKSTLTNVVIGNYEIPSHVSDSARDLITHCLVKNPRERIRLTDVPGHPFFDPVRGTESCNTYGSDSGLYTISTNNTTRNTKAPLSAICEDRELRAATDGHPLPPSNRLDAYQNAYLNSPPVRLRANPNSAPFQHGGMFGNLKKQFVGLPMLNKNEPILSLPQGGAYPLPSIPQGGGYPLLSPVGEYPYNLPPSDPRGRDVSEERPRETSCCSSTARPAREGAPDMFARGSRHRSCDSGTHEPYQLSGCSDPQERRQRPSRRGLAGGDGRDRRSFSSEGRMAARESCSGARSSSLDRGGRKAAESHDQRDVCSFCRSSTHRSWCERNRRPNHSKHSTASAHHSARSHSTNILKDIAPVKRTPSSSSVAPSPPPPLPSDAPKSTLGDHCSPLSSRRLKATRQESKNAILSILEDGEVCIEFLQTRKSQKRVHDVCRISADGLRIVLYNPNGSYGTAVADVPPRIPSKGADHIFSYDSLPQKYWKKYIYAARFVRLVREKTPKITYYSDLAQCILMENAPNADFVAKFFTGEKLLIVSGRVEMSGGGGKQICVPEEACQAGAEDHVTRLYEHAQEIKQLCLDEERDKSEKERKWGRSMFPIVIGKRPSSSSTPPSLRTLNKENVSPVSVQSSRLLNAVGQLGPYEESVGSLASGYAHLRRPLTSQRDNSNIPNAQNCPQKVILENIGCLYQKNTEMTLHFLDGTSLQMSGHRPSGFTYTDASNRSLAFSVDSPSIPRDVRQKLTQFLEALAQLNAASARSKKAPLQRKIPFIGMNAPPPPLPSRNVYMR